MVTRSERVWPFLSILAALVPFFGGLSLTHVFSVRDLTMFFWPRHLWIRHALLSGRWPLWDPYAAAGQAAFPDALNQLFLPPVLLLRVLVPAVVGFNLIVALPFPLAALGTWLWLRRHVSSLSSMSAAFGAVAFAVSGPVVSTGNFPNLSWSVAFIPWILWAADRDAATRSRQSLAILSACIALQILSGEPVTNAATLALLVIDVARLGAPGRRLSALARAASAIALAVGVSAVQWLPMIAAGRASPRGLMRADNLWSLHPLWLVESVLPHVFGNVLHAYESQLPWLGPLNSGRDPFFYSLYVGTVVLALAIVGTMGRRRWSVFWLVVIAMSVLVAFGDSFPVYPALQRLVPPARSLRFPVKFLVFASLGLAALAAMGMQDLVDDSRESRSIPAAITIMVLVIAALVGLVSMVVATPFAGARALFALGRHVGLRDPVAGAAFLFGTIPPTATRAIALWAVVAGVLAIRQYGARTIAVALCCLGGVELVAANATINPVLAASVIGPPGWVKLVANRPGDRFYFGGKFRGTLVEHDIDLAKEGWRPPANFSIEEGREVLMADVAMTPAAWGIRELISYDLPQLWSVTYAIAVQLFERAGREERLRFLARGGVRYCLTGGPPKPGLKPLGPVSDFFGSMAVYECGPQAHRAYVVPDAIVVPRVVAQLVRLFEASPELESAVMLEKGPDHDLVATQRTSVSLPPTAIVSDRDQEVVVDATAGPDGGYLVLLDSFDPSWRAEVDGTPAPVVRANALYRAVRLPPGPHRVRFVYRPTQLYRMLVVSVTSAAILIALAAV